MIRRLAKAASIPVGVIAVLVIAFVVVPIMDRYR